MARRCFRLRLALGVMVLFVVPLLPWSTGPAAAAEQVSLERWLQTTAADFTPGTFDGTAVVATGDGELHLQEGRSAGTYTSVPHEFAFPCRAAGLLYQGQVPAGTALLLELRAQDEAGAWSSWVSVPQGPWADAAGRPAGDALPVFPQAGQWLQYRVTLEGKGSALAVEEVEVVCLGGEDTPAVVALPPWKEATGWPQPVAPEKWGAEPVTATVVTATARPGRIEVRLATLAPSADIPAGPALRMLQRFQREVLGYPDMIYAFLVDAQGGVYQGRALAAGEAVGDVLYVGLLGVDPREPVSPGAEDALVALLDWWRASQPAGSQVTLSTPVDPLLAERVLARQQAGNLRRNEWLFPRGATGPDVDEWILLTNPDVTRARVTTELHRDDGRVFRWTLRLPGESRGSLYVDQVLAKASFWARVQGEGNPLAERALYYGHDADDSTGLEGLSREWYLPGGRQEPGFTTTLTLLNPGSEQVTATVTVFTPAGMAGQGTVLLAPGTRLDLPVGQVYTGTAPVGCQVQATAPIAVEQAVRFASFQAGYGLPGTPQLSRRWTFAGVETGDSFVTLLAMLNPYSETVTVTLALMSEDGTTLRRPYSVFPGEQILNLNSILPELALAADVQAGRPIAMARVTYFNGLSAAQATLGAVRPARTWYLPEGSTGEPFETFLLVANPNPVPTGLQVTFMDAGGELSEARLSVPAHARLTVPLNQIVPGVAGLSTRVEAEWPVVVERSMYLHGREGGHACLGIAR
jgi:hypothetical protein